MKIGIIILCRYSSQRLPGKILMDFMGESLLSRIVSRLSGIELPMVVATSIHKTDDPIEAYCISNQIDVFRGDLEDVAGRFLNCAKQYDMDYAVRINGDNLFTDPAIIEQLVEVINTEDYDFLSNVPDRTFPIGMSVEMVRTAFFENIYQSFDQAHYKEHVTLFLYDNPTLGKRFYLRNEECPFEGQIRLAIDTPSDRDMAIKILQLSDGNFNQLSLCEIIRLWRKLKNEQLER